MKKLLLMSVITLMLGTTSAYAKCEGGVEFQGVINKHIYCISSTTMTWWAAFAWCEFQGRELASLSDACIEWNGANASNSMCPNLVGIGNKTGWVANAFSSSSASSINLSTGSTITPNHLKNISYHSALCY